MPLRKTPENEFTDKMEASQGSFALFFVFGNVRNSLQGLGVYGFLYKKEI